MHAAARMVKWSNLHFYFRVCVFTLLGSRLQHVSRCFMHRVVATNTSVETVSPSPRRPYLEVGVVEFVEDARLKNDRMVGCDEYFGAGVD